MFGCASEPTSFACHEDGGCSAEGMGGACEANGFCSFPDDECASGRRYGTSNGAVSGLCVPPQTGTTASDSRTSGAQTTSTTDSVGSATSDGSTSMPLTGGMTSTSVATTGSTESTTTSGRTMSTGSTDAGSTGDGGQVVTLAPDIAECTDSVDHDPDLCEEVNGDGNMVADGLDAGSDQESRIFIRFPALPNANVEDVVAVRLELTVTDDANAASSSSGEVFETVPFGLAELQSDQPSIVGGVIGEDQGDVTELRVVTFQLPTAVLVQDQALHLSIVNPTSNGVNYWNLDGTDPPRLVIELQ